MKFVAGSAPGKGKPGATRKAYSCRGLPKALPTDGQNNTGSVRNERIRWVEAPGVGCAGARDETF